jgi:hypothetical protein
MDQHERHLGRRLIITHDDTACMSEQHEAVDGLCSI